MCQCSHRATLKDPTTTSTKACPLPSSVRGSQVRPFGFIYRCSGKNISTIYLCTSGVYVYFSAPEGISHSSFKIILLIKATVVHTLRPIVFWEAKRECVYMHVCVCVCACVHSLSVEDVRAVMQKPSPGFCLAGGFMQLSVLKKGEGISGLFVLSKTYFSFVLAPSSAA